ncbi:MAG TPA: metal-dependent hydrolase [Burkholderiales bacterium]|nr:metal-dependent hydrolase [Burkholderiales bacterium]
MDTLTHALSGALLARATAPKDAPPRSLPRRVAAGFFACAAPDLDFVIGYAGPVEYILHHRGVTHSVLLAPLWAIAVAWLLAKILREPRGWKALYGTSLLCLWLHIAGDWITGFGTIMFSPFSDWRVALGTTFIIDLWFSGIILAGLVFSGIFHRTRIPAVAASVVLIGYVAFQYVLKSQAVDFGLQYAAARGLSGVRVVAHPRPVTPFNWTVFVSDENVHRFAHVNLVRKSIKKYEPGDGFIARIDSPYLPLDQAIWVTRTRYGEADVQSAREAWNSQGLAFFRWFADLPAFDGRTDGCVWFNDLRFLTPGRPTLPFRFGACQEAGAWRPYERLGETGKAPISRLWSR